MSTTKYRGVSFCDRVVALTLPLQKSVSCSITKQSVVIVQYVSGFTCTSLGTASSISVGCYLVSLTKR